MPSSPARMTRRLSRPFTDLSNLLRPLLHEERGISSHKAASLSQARRESGGVSSADCVFVDSDPEEADASRTGAEGVPASDSAGTITASGTTSNFHQLFLTDSRSSGSTVNGSPPRFGPDARRRSGPQMSQQTANLFDTDSAHSTSRPTHTSRQSWGQSTILNLTLPPLDEEHPERAPSPTLSLAVSQAADLASAESSTPTALASSTTKGELGSVSQLQPSITLLGESPERRRSATPLVVETCPTPPTTARTTYAPLTAHESLASSPRRSRFSEAAPAIPSLIRSTTHDEIALGLAEPVDDEVDYTAVLLAHPTANSSRSSSVTTRRSLSNLFTGGLGSSPRTSQPSPVTPNTQYGFPFPELVGRFLDSTGPETPPKLAHLRPTYAYAPPSPSIGGGTFKGKKSRPSTPASEALLHKATSYQTGTLKNSESNSTLFSWDLAHLPAPGNPREEPYKVSTMSMFLPTAFLGGQRYSGQFGDQFGPVGRKAEKATVKRAKSTKKGEEDQKKKRRMSVASLGTLLGGVELGPSRTGGTMRTERERGSSVWKGTARRLRSAMSFAGGSAAKDEEAERRRIEEELDSWVAIVVADR